MAQKRDPKHQLRQICSVAARVFYDKGYDGASMQDIADAVGLTKAGLYHHVRSKDRLLFEIMNYGMDILDEAVLSKVRGIREPRERLRQLIAGHIDLVVRTRNLEITVILHENRSLKGPLRARINARKRDYIRFLESTIEEVRTATPCRPAISSRLAAFALLGMINWLYQWYELGGAVSEEELVLSSTRFFLRGFLGEA
jgi:AcrR family transcriptional regulator